MEHVRADLRPSNDGYEIVGRIATGGMAAVYLARKRTVGGVTRDVALKRLLPALRFDDGFVQMFRDEARLAAQLRHQNIVRIFDSGELDGSLFLAMEFVRGVDLRAIIARLKARRRFLPTSLVLRIAAGALEALAYAHDFRDARGKRWNIVHRDISPQNLLVGFDGGVKLLDFGVARAEGKGHQTETGLVKGKFGYMAPEQIGGHGVDARSDLFSLAVVLYELLTLEHPFAGRSDIEIIRNIAQNTPGHPTALNSEIPESVGGLLLRAMSKSSAARFEGAEAMLRALRETAVPSASAKVLADDVRDLFSDRIAAEREARSCGDDGALLRAVRMGHGEMPEPEGAPRVDEAMDDATGDTGTDTERRDAVDSGITSPDGLGTELRRIFDQDEAEADDEAPTVFLASVGKAPPAVPPARPRRRRWAWVVAGVVLVAALAGRLGFSGSDAPRLRLELLTEPSGAHVFLDGFDVGTTTPATLLTTADEDHRIGLRMRGFPEHQVAIPKSALPATQRIVWRFADEKNEAP